MLAAAAYYADFTPQVINCSAKALHLDGRRRATKQRAPKPCVSELIYTRPAASRRDLSSEQRRELVARARATAPLNGTTVLIDAGTAVDLAPRAALFVDGVTYVPLVPTPISPRARTSSRYRLQSTGGCTAWRGRWTPLTTNEEVFDPSPAAALRTMRRTTPTSTTPRVRRLGGRRRQAWRQRRGHRARAQTPARRRRRRRERSATRRRRCRCSSCRRRPAAGRWPAVRRAWRAGLAARLWRSSRLELPV